MTNKSSETMTPQSLEHTIIKGKVEHCYICHGAIRITTHTYLPTQLLSIQRTQINLNYLTKNDTLRARVSTPNGMQSQHPKQPTTMMTNQLLRATTTSTNQLLATHTNKHPCSEPNFPKQTNKQRRRRRKRRRRRQRLRSRRRKRNCTLVTWLSRTKKLNNMYSRSQRKSEEEAEAKNRAQGKCRARVLKF